MSKDINRLKVVLAEKKRTNKWLAEQLGKDPATISKWCTNTLQPNVETLVEIAKHLNVDIQELFWPIELVLIMEDNKRNILNGQINKIQDVIDWLTINFNLFDIVDGVNPMEIVKENFKKLFSK